MKETSRFYSSLRLLIILNVVVKPLWVFAIDRQVQNTVGAVAYGAYFSLYSLSVVLSFLADLGFTIFINRQLASKDKSFNTQLGNFLLLKLLLAFFYALVVFTVVGIAGTTHWSILWYLILLQVFNSFYLFFRSVITAHQWFQADAWLSIADKALIILLCGSLLYFPGTFGYITLEKFLILQVGCYAFAMTAGLILLLTRKISFPLAKKWFPSKALFRSAFPYALAILLMAAHSRLDAFLLERMNTKGAYQAGIYAAAYRLLDASNMAGYLFTSFLLPYISRQWSEKKDFSSVILQSRHFLLMFSAGLACIGIFLAGWIQQVLYHSSDINGKEVLQWCLPALIAYSLTNIYGAVLTATGFVRSFCYIILLSLTINIILNVLFIPYWGAKGACFSALCSQFFCAITAMLFARQKLKLSVHYPSLLIYLFTGIALAVFFYASGDWPISKWLLIVAAVMITFLIMITTKLLNIKILISSWRKA